jgi:hypothetical protein
MATHGEAVLGRDHEVKRSGAHVAEKVVRTMHLSDGGESGSQDVVLLQMNELPASDDWIPALFGGINGRCRYEPELLAKHNVKQR